MLALTSGNRGTQHLAASWTGSGHFRDTYATRIDETGPDHGNNHRTIYTKFVTDFSTEPGQDHCVRPGEVHMSVTGACWLSGVAKSGCDAIDGEEQRSLEIAIIAIGGS